MNTELEQSIAELAKSAMADGFRLVVGAGIRHNDRLLIVRRAATEDFLPEYWEIPGGGVDEGETLLQALGRELQEETGLIIQSIDSLVGQFDYHLTKGPCRQFTILLNVTNPDIRLNPQEHDAFKWIGPEEQSELETLQLTPQMRETLDRILTRMIADQASARVSA